MRALHGETSGLRTLWVSESAARVTRIPEEGVWRRLSHLKLALGAVGRFRGLAETGQSIFYRLRETEDGPAGEMDGRQRLPRMPGSPGRG